MPVSVRQSPFERAAKSGQISIPSNVEKPDTRSKGDKWIEPFITAIMEGSSVRDATRQAGVHATLPFKRRVYDENFRTAWKEASDIGTELMEQEAARRAYHGVLEPVFHKGEECGHVRRYSDTLMIFLLKGRKPEVYRDGVEDNDKRGSFVVNINVEAVSDKQPTVVVQPEVPGLVEVEVVGTDGNQQDR